MDRFANAFLVPAESLLAEVGTRRSKISPCEIVRLKHVYGVSASALLARLGQVGVLRKGFVPHAFRTFARSWRRSEPNPIQPGQGFAAIEKPGRFERLVWRAVGEWLISPIRAACLLNQSLESVERQIRGEPFR